MSIPQADKLEDKGELMDYGIAFSLLSKPTLDLSDHELLLVANDLRAKRVKFLNGVKDNPAKKRLAKPKPTPEEKAARTEHLKTQLKLGGLKL